MNPTTSASPKEQTNAITIDHLRVQRGELVLCENVCFSVGVGKTVHILGQNGAGKSTLLLMLAGIIPVQHGHIAWENKPIDQWQTLFIGHKVALNLHMTVSENLRFLVQLQQDNKYMTLTGNQLTSALVWAGLAGYEQEKVSRLSAGQMRRVQLARLHVDVAQATPKKQRLWLLDEPLTALDMHFSMKLQQLMAHFSNLGGRIVCTSHQSLNHEILSGVFLLDLNQFAADITLENDSVLVVNN